MDAVVAARERARKNQGQVHLDYNYAGSGLPHGPFVENYLFALQVGLGWVFVNGLKWVQKWVKSGFLGAKVGQNASKPTFPPT